MSSTLDMGIRGALLAVAGITRLVDRRIRPFIVGQREVLPYITYSITDGKTEATLAGEVADYQTAEFELAIYGDSYDAVSELSTLAKNCLDQNGNTVAGVEFAPCEFDSQTDVEQIPLEGQELPAAYLRTQTYKVLYKIVG